MYFKEWDTSSGKTGTFSRSKFGLSTNLDLSTLNMLNSFKVYKIYIHILNCILDFAWLKQTKSTLEQQYMLSVLHKQYHACRRSGDFRSQGINSVVLNPKTGIFRLQHQKNWYFFLYPLWTLGKSILSAGACFLKYNVQQIHLRLILRCNMAYLEMISMA